MFAWNIMNQVLQLCMLLLYQFQYQISLLIIIVIFSYTIYRGEAWPPSQSSSIPFYSCTDQDQNLSVVRILFSPGRYCYVDHMEIVCSQYLELNKHKSPILGKNVPIIGGN